MNRLTRFITPVGMCMTNLNSMRHYKPCVPCRHKAEMKIDANGKGYTEKHSYCDTCEVKMLFNKLKQYEDLEEHGRLIKLPCKPFEKVWVAHLKFPTHQTMFCCNTHILETMEAGYVIGYTEEEAEAKLKEKEVRND